MGCHSKKKASLKLLRLDHQWLDSVKKSCDSVYTRKYGTTKFAIAEYFINKKDGIVCQVMKDSLDAVRQIIISKKSRRSFFAEYYSNGQLMAQLPLDSFGQYHGRSIYYYEEGVIESEGEYSNGLKKGAWKNYPKNGKGFTINEYNQNGQVIK